MSNYKIEKMNCDGCKIKTMDYFEGSLSEADRKEYEAHLEECAICRGFAAYVSELLKSVSRSGINKVDPYFFARLKARMENRAGQNERKREITGVVRPLFYSFLLAASIVAGIVIGSYGSFTGATEPRAEHMVPWMNEMRNEPIENFFMD